jgi:hypothetical protein
VVSVTLGYGRPLFVSFFFRELYRRKLALVHLNTRQQTAHWTVRHRNPDNRRMSPSKLRDSPLQNSSNVTINSWRVEIWSIRLSENRRGFAKIGTFSPAFVFLRNYPLLTGFV